MWDFFIKYWIEVLFGLFSTIMLAWIKNLQNKLKIKQIEQDALKSGMIALLHNQLTGVCNKYLALGYIPVSESEDVLNDAKKLYDAYHGIGGNGTGTTIYEKFLKLQIRG